VKIGPAALLIPPDLGNTFLEAGITEAVMSTKVTVKGQVTIPKGIRDMLGLKPGMEVEFKGGGADGEVILKRADGRRLPSRFEKYRGFLGPSPSTDEIMKLLRGDD
jgi:AbrB family looped-hinge helix DNA binding protein